MALEKKIKANYGDCGKTVKLEGSLYYKEESKELWRKVYAKLDNFSLALTSYDSGETPFFERIWLDKTKISIDYQSSSRKDDCAIIHLTPRKGDCKLLLSESLSNSMEWVEAITIATCLTSQLDTELIKLCEKSAKTRQDGRAEMDQNRTKLLEEMLQNKRELENKIKNPQLNILSARLLDIESRFDLAYLTEKQELEKKCTFLKQRRASLELKINAIEKLKEDKLIIRTEYNYTHDLKPKLNAIDRCLGITVKSYDEKIKELGKQKMAQLRSLNVSDEFLESLCINVVDAEKKKYREINTDDKKKAVKRTDTFTNKLHKLIPTPIMRRNFGSLGNLTTATDSGPLEKENYLKRLFRKPVILRKRHSDAFIKQRPVSEEVNLAKRNAMAISRDDLGLEKRFQRSADDLLQEFSKQDKSVPSFRKLSQPENYKPKTSGRKRMDETQAFAEIEAFEMLIHDCFPQNSESVNENEEFESDTCIEISRL